ARFCNNCGAALGGDPAQAAAATVTRTTFDPRFGEADLLETELNWRGGIYIVGGMVTLLLAIVAVGVLLALNPSAVADTLRNPPAAESQPAQAAPVEQNFLTNTPRPTMFVSTVTQAPPTITQTPTPGPCQIEVQPGSTLYGILALCGHRDFDLLDEVLELNDLPDAASLQLGQVIEVPRPTATPDPNAPTAEAGDEVEGEASGGIAGVLFADDIDNLPTLTPLPTATLPVGIQWYTVQSGENILTVATRFEAGVEVLSQLNPEIEFNQCDFGIFGGGPDCTVFLSAGQRVRVPAPTPTPTLVPTLTGSETATPTATATFNAPNLVSPGDRVLFRRNELVTLRWAGTGTLDTDEVYRLRIKNMDTGLEYIQDTRESFFIVPTEWQQTDGKRYDYEWQVSVIDLRTPEDPIFVTDQRLFTWEATTEDATPEPEGE
ncbi:MAG: LysM domain-containing protein, partial [Chloroflexota bacterium]